jgi:hypothetical protein
MTPEEQRAAQALANGMAASAAHTVAEPMERRKARLRKPPPSSH